ncbi:Oidioi.mRNA.OKI2018_I69.chr1.g1752.t1.cds [Oikopleura dioica]|uniref:Oidioi.mRNA.OKI2018_I69.chr1.g1752.t1.cds n=1 Tax=Oikopleura dioica TaxID=34765 RepID=A0ABN7STX4_OIKDI|nr:Oidioi.mRNA.OKI2018_I69.chr1.g1752.t1.cds [Oikopleura dioica]
MLLCRALFLSSVTAIERRTDVECQDQEIHDNCLTGCRLVYIDCLSNCESSFCNSECLLEFQDCDASCPCGYNCPSGCKDCVDHPLCGSACEDPQINNDEYRLCVNEEIYQLDLCLKDCTADLNCHDSCYESYREGVLRCPCMEGSSTTTTSPATTTDSGPISPSDIFILSILHDVELSYLMNGDGSSNFPANITQQMQDQVTYSKHAMIQDTLYIFGTQTKIAKLDGCNIVELAQKLLFDRSEHTEALSIDDGTRALICFAYTNYQNLPVCEIFDGEASEVTFNSSATHLHGGLGFYKGQPTTTGCHREKHPKTETLGVNGWTDLPDFPEKPEACHNLIGLRNGAMILVGGYSYTPRIWQLKDETWTKLGELEMEHGLGSAIYINNYIFVYPGGPANDAGHAVQRIDLTDEEEFISSEIIGTHSGCVDNVNNENGIVKDVDIDNKSNKNRYANRVIFNTINVDGDNNIL